MTSVTGGDGTTGAPVVRDVGGQSVGGTGIVVSPIALDAGVFGWAAGIDDAGEVLSLFHETGGNLICTADHYAGGRSEIMIGSWLRGIKDRGSVVISTEIGRHPDAPGLSSRSILRAVESSLDRLGTDYVDFLSFDADHSETPLDDTLEAVDRLVREGKVRYLAASGFSADRIREVAKLSAEAKYPAFQAILVEYNLMEREAYESDLQAAAVALGHSALARLPLANGYLTGQFRTRDDIPTSIMWGGAMRHVGRRGTRVLDALLQVARELETTSECVALAWVLLKPGIASAVLRVKDAKQLSGAIGATGLRLTRSQVAQLNRASVR